MIKAVFFDFYNTLAHYQPKAEQIQIDACAALGIDVPLSRMQRACLRHEPWRIVQAERTIGLALGAAVALSAAAAAAEDNTFADVTAAPQSPPSLQGPRRMGLGRQPAVAQGGVPALRRRA